MCVGARNSYYTVLVNYFKWRFAFFINFKWLGCGQSLPYDITAIFAVKKYDGDLRVNNNESKKLEWFNVGNLPSNMIEHTKNYLEKYGDILGMALNIYKGVNK